MMNEAKEFTVSGSLELARPQEGKIPYKEEVKWIMEI